MIVKHRAKPYILSPQKLYECVGDVTKRCLPVCSFTWSGHRSFWHFIMVGRRHRCGCVGLHQRLDEL